MKKNILYTAFVVLVMWAGLAFSAENGNNATNANNTNNANNKSGQRLFVLKYNLNRYTVEVKESTAYVFNHVLSEQDQLLVLAGERTLYFDSVSDKVKAFAVVESVLNEQAAWNRQLMQSEIKSMGEYITWVRKQAKEDVHPGATYGDWKGVHPHYYMKYLKNSIERYLDMLTGYKEKFMLPDIVKNVRVFSHLKKASAERWYISFYQPPLLPGYARENREMIDEWIKELSQRGWLDEQDYVKKLNRLQDSIDDAFEVVSTHYDPLFDELAAQFIKAGVTYHTVFLSEVENNQNSQLELAGTAKPAILNGLRNRFEKVAQLTGGILCTANALEAAAHPSPLLAKNNISGLPKTSSYLAKRLEHLARTGKDQTDICIEDISFKRKTLSMIINGFAQAADKKPEKEKNGKLNVLVRIIDKNGKVVFDKKKALLAQKESIALSLDFNWLKAGKYFLITDAKDLITGKAWACVSGFEIY